MKKSSKILLYMPVPDSLKPKVVAGKKEALLPTKPAVKLDTGGKLGESDFGNLLKQFENKPFAIFDDCDLFISPKINVSVADLLTKKKALIQKKQTKEKPILQYIGQAKSILNNQPVYKVVGNLNMTADPMKLTADSAPSYLGHVGGAYGFSIDIPMYKIDHASHLTSLKSSEIYKDIISRLKSELAIKAFSFDDVDVLVSPKSSNLKTSTKIQSSPIEAEAAQLRIGVWDLGAWVGRLSEIIQLLNDVQTSYEFIQVEAMVPLEMIRTREGAVAWAEHAVPDKLDKQQIKFFENNTIANDYFGLASTVRENLGIDFIVGITPGMVAGKKDSGEVYWNHFATWSNNLLLVSTYNLRKFAKTTDRPYEAFLSGIIVAQLLVAQFDNQKLRFHTENRGCLFDYNVDRASIMDKVKGLHIEPECLEKIAPKYRDAALAFVKLLLNYKLP